jgi:carboxypeptidase C (cathepsin A)
VRNEADDPIGTLFSFSYLEDDASAARRPVTFVFNGGPGSSSAWLNLGGIGPRRVVLQSPVPHPTPPFEVIDNANSPLQATDLVFIDPVGTGFSRLRGKGSPSDFYGTPQDAANIARFIESWLSEHHRWDSPKFLIGESYGTVRANLLSAVLMNSGDGLRAITLNGVILIGHDGGLVPLESETRFQTNFTTLAAAAWYHNRVERRNRTFEQFIAGAAEFAQNELGPALDAGLRVTSDPARMTHLSERMAEFTGLSAGYLRGKNLRVSQVTFSHELLREQGMDLGLYDSRSTLPAKIQLDAVGLNPEAPLADVADDPSVADIAPAFAGALHDHILRELNVTIDEPYRLLSNLQDQWKSVGARIDPAAALVNSMRRNPRLQVMFAGGWYDLIAGTIGAAEYGASRQIPPDRTVIKKYTAGHMVYLGDANEQFCRDVAEFIINAANPK